jgi:hypothetical protein
MHSGFEWKSVKERDHLEHLDAGSGIILKSILRTDGSPLLHRLRADCSPLSTGALYGRSQRVTIPDAVKIQF